MRISEEETTIQSITAERLSRTEIFRSLPKEDLFVLANFCREESFPDGSTVIVEGEPAEKLFLLERGKLALEKKVQITRDTIARTATIGYVSPGKMAGVSTLAPPHIYSTSVVCVEPSRLIIVDGPALRNHLQESPEAGLIVMNSISALLNERFRDSTSSLTYFLSIISHELRSPLAAIENYLNTMLGGFAGEITSKQKHMLQRCVLRLVDMRGLIGDVVDLARMRPEQIQADFEWFDPGEVGAEAIEDVRMAGAEKGIRIRVEPPLSFEPIVGARRRIRQVFTNLLNNAIKFSPENGTVIFRAWYDPDAVVFEVEDHGPGIPPSELPYIFEDFYRASNISGVPGSGLGLSISKKIMEAHEGQISVKNLAETEGKSGTRLTVRIPRNLKTPEMRRQDWR
jgi:signal transduction histidine kinase